MSDEGDKGRGRESGRDRSEATTEKSSTDDLLADLGSLGDVGSTSGVLDIGTESTSGGDGKDTKTTAGRRRTKSTGGGRRLIGVLALLLGVVGSLLAIVAAAVSIRFGAGASGTIEQLMSPIGIATDRLETRIDQVDDLVESGGVDAAAVPEVEARVDGMVDLARSARQTTTAIEDRPVYGRLPSDVEGLLEELVWFEDRAEAIDSAVRSVDEADGGIDAATAAAVVDDVNEMQATVSAVQDRVETTERSLRRWARMASVLGLFVSLWGLWGQISLARRGWRGVRRRPRQ